jgi:hypothetical protein
MRARYWTCGSFADWLRGTPKPGAETSKGWRNWKKAAKAAHPFRYWLAEEFLHKLQNIVSWPGDKLNDLRYYINNRYISHSHALTAHPRDISPGSWCDVGNRFLPCMFNELVDFIEVEQAWHHCAWSEEAGKKYNIPWSRSFFRFRTWRCPEAGMDYLVWASGLMMDDNSGPTQQAINAKELIDLYVWWTAIRPQRPDPYEASGWSALCEKRRKNNDDDDLFFEDETPEDKALSREALDKCHAMEEQYEQEDEEMMIRLIKVRRGLWT